jgi:hypothetical protein
MVTKYLKMLLFIDNRQKDDDLNPFQYNNRADWPIVVFVSAVSITIVVIIIGIIYTVK